jgi:hypothetical protein
MNRPTTKIATNVAVLVSVASVAFAASPVRVWPTEPGPARRETQFRMGFDRSIVAIRPSGNAESAQPQRASSTWPHPRPRLTGFSPLIVIATSDERSTTDIDYEHNIHDFFYVGNPLPTAGAQEFIVGILDTGAVVDLAAGKSADILGLTGPMLTQYTIPLAGAAGQIDAPITQPLGVFAGGLSAGNPDGTFDHGAMVGHSNVSAVAAPALVCGPEETPFAVIGTAFLGFFDIIIRVDTPQTLSVGGETFTGPEVQIDGFLSPSFSIAHRIGIEFGGPLPVTTASYYPDFEDLVTPQFPTQLSASALSLPLGGAFFTTMEVAHGGGATQSMRVLVDTGAQSSIISPFMAASLSLPLKPDFGVDVCGIGGVTEDAPGYYVDYVRINAQGGALEFSRAPFVVLDLPSPEGGSLDGILGMNFFWNRNIYLEPSVDLSGFMSLSAPIPVAFGDNDVDFDVDEADYGVFASCVPDAIGGPLSPECDHLDADGDLDIDLLDYGQFQDCFSGNGIEADPSCGGSATGS